LEQTISETGFQRIDALDAEIRNLRTQRSNFNIEWKNCAEQRNSLNSQLRELSEKIRAIRSQRDAMNESVKALKSSRDKLRSEIVEKRDRIGEMIPNFKQLRSHVQGTFHETKDSFEKLEWQLQTSSLDSKEENRLLTQIKELELQLAKHQRLNELQRAFDDQKTAIETLRRDAQSVHEKILEAAESSAQMHNEMMRLVEDLKEIKASADAAHKKYLEARTETERVEQELVHRVIERKKIHQEIFGEEEAERLRKRKEVAERLTESGSAKLSQGKRLSFEEFRALMEQKKI